MTRLRLLFFFTHWVKGTLSPTHYINGGFLLLLIPIQEVGRRPKRFVRRKLRSVRPITLKELLFFYFVFLLECRLFETHSPIRTISSYEVEMVQC